MSQGLHPLLQVVIALAALAILVWPEDEANWVDSDEGEFDAAGRRDL
jgi:hypothetical protein